MQKLDGQSKDILAENIDKIKEIFPEVFCEDKIDFEKLQEVLGEYVEDKEERYRFEWNGKSKAIRLAQTPSTGTLRPSKKYEDGKDDSKNWDTTGNLYIEGDNLEVLKLLQKTYNSSIKMIYIDPPYNTGKDFVYKDNYRDNLQNYLEITGQLDDEGKKISTNSEASGRYHTDWLNMMYPRLRLARNLLTDDGVIFISIDDNEVDNLKKICNEVFGEGNFVGTITWEKRTKAQNTIDARDMFQSKTEYIFIYKKSVSKIRFNLETLGTKEYNKKDEKGVFRYKVVEEMSSLGMRGRTTMIFPVLGVIPGKDKQWKVGSDAVNEFIERDDLVLIDNKPYFKIRPSDEDVKTYYPFWSHFFDKDTYGTAETGKSELSNTLGTKSHDFETVKPTLLIKKLLFHVKDMFKESLVSEDIVLDFFSGSATTAHATMQLNAEDGGNRKFIMVQLPELTDETSEAYKAGYKNICEIGKERIRRAGEKIVAELKEKQLGQQSILDGNSDDNAVDLKDLDIGFKVFKLDSSNLKKWNPDYDNLEFAIDDMITNFVEGRTEEDVLYEIMLKYGIDLTYPIETEEVNGKKVFIIGIGALFICLAKDITTDVAEFIAKKKDELKPNATRVVFKDNGFKNDSVKTNTIQILKRNGIEEIMSV